MRINEKYVCPWLLVRYNEWEVCNNNPPVAACLVQLDVLYKDAEVSIRELLHNYAVEGEYSRSEALDRMLRYSYQLCIEALREYRKDYADTVYAKDKLDSLYNTFIEIMVHTHD